CPQRGRRVARRDEEKRGARASAGPRPAPWARGVMSAQLSLFYASDIHGSERVFRKFLNAARFYRVQAVIFGGDLTGKAMIPFVETSTGVSKPEVPGVLQWVSDGTALDELEQFVRDTGSYPSRTTPEEMAALQSDPRLVTQVFTRAMAKTAEKWVTLA